MTHIEKLIEKDGKLFEAITVDHAGQLKLPFVDVLFPCLIWGHDGRSTDAKRSVIASALLDAGCRYAVCGGENCDAWHEAVDVEFVKRHIDDPDDVLDSVHVMTTSHDGEAPDDVAFFFVLNTNFV